MKKILSFLALLMVAFALPSKMQAYDGYGLKASDGSWIGLNWDGSKLTGTLDGWNGKQFKVEAYWNNGNHQYGYAGSDYGINGNASYDANVTTNNAGYFKVNTSNKYNVTVYLDNNTFGNGPYRIVLNKAPVTYDILGNFPDASSAWKSTSMTNVSGSKWVAENVVVTTTSQFGIRQLTNGSQSAWISASGTSSITASGTFNCKNDGTNFSIAPGTWTLTFDSSTNKLTAELAPTAPETLYLVNDGNAGTQTATNDGSNVFTYSVYFHAGNTMHLSTSSTGAAGTNYGPSSNTDLVDGNAHSYSKVDSKYWVAPVDGTYDITVNWDNSTFTATWEASFAPLYLYNDQPWATKMATLNSKTGIYTTVVKMGAGTNFVLSTKDKTGTDYNGLTNEIYTHGIGVTTLESGVASSFSNTNTGCWKAPKTGEYTITIDWNNKTLTATWTVPVKKVHMPLSESDFENGKKHYFLVGNRMGEWRLLPEWELKADANGDMVLKNRWIYPGGFAIGVVDSYDNYIKHKYTYYSKQWAFKDDVLECNEDFSGTGASMTATGTIQSPSNNFWTEFSSSNGGGDYWQATGTFVTEIRVGLNGSGLPSTLTLKVGEKADFNKHRFFTLVGNGIYNTNFCNSYGPGTTLQKSKGQSTDNGWQEGWIQYDPVTHEPYVDGNYNYLYHTSYTPDYFKTNPSLFNQTLADGSTFSYTSNEAQFVEYNNLDNLDSDPYREFYQVFNEKETIKTGVEVPAGNGYDFKVETVNGDFTPTDNWHCYVVRDMWVSGEFKIWTGWGGNDTYTGGSLNGGSTWHGENAGPDRSSTQEVEAYDVTSGGTVKLYRNGKNIDGANYKTPSGNLVYYNRVILWYNVTDGIGGDNSTGSGNTPGVGRSFVQFIQESAGPAIFAQLATNPKTAANNYIKYNWYLNKAQNATDSNRKVVGYQIQRYRYVDGVKTFIGYPEGDYVDISEHNVTVANLQQATAGNYSFTTFTDAGIDGISGFAPGMYQYDIVVTFEDGTKSAVSNKVAIYDSNIITPSAYALQLVRLNDAGKEELGVSQEYLTYNPSVEGNWFVLDVEKIIVDEETTYGKPYNADLRVGSEMLKFMMNNQDKYDFTSNFYIRALDKKIYDSTFEEYMKEGLVTNTSIPTPTVTASDGTVTSQAYEFDLGVNKFYSAVLFRKGSLDKSTGQVTVEYTYLDANGNEQTESPINQTELQPVTPRPYNPTYSYDIDSYDMVVANNAYVAIDNTPKRGSLSFDVPSKITTLKAATNGGKLATNLLVLNIKFNRPNVDEEILANYTIKEEVSTIKDDAGFWFYYADDKVAKVEHEISDKGVSPYNSSIPLVDFFGTHFEGKKDAEGNSLFDDSPVGTFGYGIKFEAPHAIESTPGAGLSGVHLGKIKRENGTWDWMYKGHESLDDEAPVLVKTGKTYENQEKQTIAPNYYLYELSNGNDNMAYDFLVTHSACDHRKDEVVVDKTTGFVLNDEDPLIGTYIAKGFAEETTPGVFVSSIYLFYQALEQYIDGKLVDSNAENQNLLALDLPTKDEMAAGNVGGMPDQGSNVTIDGHWRGWAVLGQTYSYTPSNNNVTGVEDVLAEGESGEVVYYNLQGIRVDNPKAAGVYVRVQGKDVKKVVIK